MRAATISLSLFGLLAPMAAHAETLEVVMNNRGEYGSMVYEPDFVAIAPGDTVITDTLDAWGADATGAFVGARPNPMTGPFFIEGAEIFGGHPGEITFMDRIALAAQQLGAFGIKLNAHHLIPASAAIFG